MNVRKRPRSSASNTTNTSIFTVYSSTIHDLSTTMGTKSVKTTSTQKQTRVNPVRRVVTLKKKIVRNVSEDLNETALIKIRMFYRARGGHEDRGEEWFLQITTSRRETFSQRRSSKASLKKESRWWGSTSCSWTQWRRSTKRITWEWELDDVVEIVHIEKRRQFVTLRIVWLRIWLSLWPR